MGRSDDSGGQTIGLPTAYFFRDTQVGGVQKSCALNSQSLNQVINLNFEVT